MEIVAKHYDQLTKEELYEILLLRAQVFVVEQNCAYQDPDGKDQTAVHVMGLQNDKLVAYARIFGPGEYFELAGMGRIMVKDSHRAEGYGRKIVLAAMDAAQEHFNTQEMKLSAQTYLQKFYEELGFEVSGDEYLEDGIPHIAMIKR